VVTAEAQENPNVTTLVLDPAHDRADHSGSGSGIAAGIERGSGTTLDDQSTIAATTTRLDGAAREIAVVAGNLASQSGQDSTVALAKYAIGFVLLEPGQAGAATHQRTADALDGNPALSSVGQTDNGLLWRVVHPARGAAANSVANTATPLGRGILLGQAVVIGLTVLLGLPTSRRRRRRAVSGSTAGEPADTFEDVDDD
jgi:hypothetical protein